ncbi:hypothetical protein F383_18527 [Gossypium arboreum]|uniref:Uncharacterized protein n=1 Tax=Gossypium arboreum TaxID=29729 RepID=A0A0B0NH29_GOSAR|nr:hypothetical protein F383_18527 [Gossypium arboreum]
MSDMCASVRHVWDMHRPHYESQRKTCQGHAPALRRELVAAKVAHRSSPYVGEASHNIPEAFAIASFIILIMACIETSLFVMVVLF